MGYHKDSIEKGQVGEISKITEEYQELMDAVKQGDKILEICELTDLVGAMDLYVKNKYNLTIMDLIRFSAKTQEAFIDGSRE